MALAFRSSVSILFKAAKIQKRTTPIKGKLISLSTFLMVSMLLLGYAGYRLDQWLDSRIPYGTIGGLLFGFVLSMYETFKVVKSIEKQDKAEKLGKN